MSEAAAPAGRAYIPIASLASLAFRSPPPGQHYLTGH
jgi:hypothetical protein